MTETIDRNYLEIKSINALVDSICPDLECSIKIIKPDDFQINKFFYKEFHLLKFLQKYYFHHIAFFYYTII